MKKRILIVEDDLSTRKLIEHLLKSHYDVASVGNGYEAKLWLNSRMTSIDLIITDIEMPQMDGRQLISELKGSVNLNNIPVIVLSGNEPEELQKQLGEMGVEMFLNKPVKPKSLFERVEECLGKLAVL